MKCHGGPKEGARLRYACAMRWTVLTLIVLGLILLPFLLFEDQFNELAARLARGEASTAYTALAIGGLLSLDVFLPVPSSIVSAASGVLLGFWRGMVVIWVGMTIGCAIGYALGSRAAGAARRLVGEDGLARASAVARDYGDFALVLCRPVPLLAEASIVFGGMVRAPFRRFLLLTTVSNLGIAIGYAAIGAFSMRVESFLLAFGGAIALPAVAWLAGRIWLTRKNAS